MKLPRNLKRRESISSTQVKINSFLLNHERERYFPICWLCFYCTYLLFNCWLEWEMIDKIKASDEPSVVVNIFRVHPEATWKEIKDVYKDITMKIEKVPNKEGIFNLLFRNHNDAIEFIRVSPKVLTNDILDMYGQILIRKDNSLK